MAKLTPDRYSADMPFLPQSTSPAHGGIILSLAVTIFIISAGLMSVVVTMLWRDTGSLPATLAGLRSGSAPAPLLSPSPTATSRLESPLRLHPELASEQAAFEQRLRAPLRSYYATKPERLGEITVSPTEDEEHSTSVSYSLTTPEGETRTHTFYYDRTGKNRDGNYPTWEPGMLDNTK